MNHGYERILCRGLEKWARKDFLGFIDLDCFFFPTRRVIWTIRFFKGTRGKGRSRQGQWGRVKGQLRRKGKGRKETFQGFVCALTF